jgi:hypothetical protein
MRILFLGLIAGLALAPLTASAADPAPQAQPIAANPSPDMVVCHYYYSHGTIVGHQDCQPLHYWMWRRHQLQESIREFQLRALSQKS